MRAFALTLVAALLASSCVRPPMFASRRPMWGEHAHRIEDETRWRELAARPEDQVVARTEVVKFLIDLADGERIWFVDTERWTIHYHFARRYLSTPAHPVEDHAIFNRRQYRSAHRRFVLGSLVHYLDSDLWTFEMIAGDALEGERVLRAFELVRRAVFFGDRLRYRPLSPLHEERIAPVADRLPRVSDDEVFAGIRYQPLTRGVAFGTLRFVRGPLDPASVRPSEILVLDELPDEIPVCAGIVTAPMQAPLGHLALLAASRGTPNMSLRGALDAPSLRELDGRLVRLEVGGQLFAIREASLEEAERSWASRRPAAPLVPRVDPRPRALRDVCTLRLADAQTVGAKAAQLGEVCSVGGTVRTPGGFAVPFAHYLAHLGRAGLTRRLPALLGDREFRASSTERGRRLAEVREAIERAPVDPALVRAVRDRIAAFPGQPRVILRSSTNAEDLAGFTGAGLYRSIVVPSGASDEAIAEALRAVYASVWLQAAFEEREWYRIRHTQVAMGVLVQPFVDGAAVNGVALTANPFTSVRPALLINAQPLGGSVTGAQGDEVPEQYLVYTYNGIEPQRLTRSSRTAGQPLLTADDLHTLTDVLLRIHWHFRPEWSTGLSPEGDSAMAVDVEFLLAGPRREVVILQARPFTVRYAEGQR